MHSALFICGILQHNSPSAGKCVQIIRFLRAARRISMRPTSFLTSALLLLTLLLPVTVKAASLSLAATTYPLWLLSRAVCASVPDVQVSLVIPAGTGCPHDYAPTPADLLKLEKVQCIIANGLGMEPSLHDVLERRGDAVLYGGQLLTHALSQYAQRMPQADAAPSGGHHHHADSAVNPHIFASPRLAALLADGIADELARRDPDHAAAYRHNATRLRVALMALHQRLAALAATDAAREVVLQHNSLAYLALDAGLSVCAVVQAADDEPPSASHLMRLLQSIRQHRPALLLGEQQFSSRAMQTLSRESGVPLLTLDVLTAGSDTVPDDHFLQVMQQNVQQLEASLAR